MSENQTENDNEGAIVVWRGVPVMVVAFAIWLMIPYLSFFSNRSPVLTAFAVLMLTGLMSIVTSVFASGMAAAMHVGKIVGYSKTITDGGDGEDEAGENKRGNDVSSISRLKRQQNAQVDSESERANIISTRATSQGVCLTYVGVSGAEYTETVDIPKFGKWTREHDLPVLTAYLNIGPPWHYEQISDAGPVPVKKTAANERDPIRIDFDKMRDELPDKHAVTLCADDDKHGSDEQRESNNDNTLNEEERLEQIKPTLEEWEDKG